MDKIDLRSKRYLEDLDFFFDEENNYWYHYGDIIIEGNFDPMVNIFVDGNLTILNGCCFVRDLTVIGSLKVDSYIFCTGDLYADSIVSNNILYSCNISVLCDISVEENIHVENIIVYGKIVGRNLYATNIIVYKLKLKGTIEFYSIQYI